MKRPAFQFYPADWRKDVELQSCSMAAQGLWINVMCVAHECEPYGYLTVNGKAMNAAQLGRQVGLSARESEVLLAELLDAGVAKRTVDSIIYSKRMVADEDLRNRRADGGKGGSEHGVRGGESGVKGGRPRKPKGGLITPLSGSEKPPPSSSSSSSTSVINTNTSHALGTPPPEARAVDNPSPSPGPSVADQASAAMARAGIPDVSPSHPELLAMVNRGVTPEMFGNAAIKSVAKGKGFAYAIGVLNGQLGDAAGLASGAVVGQVPWDENRQSVDATGERLGLGPWCGNPVQELFSAYTARVRAALENRQQNNSGDC